MVTFIPFRLLRHSLSKAPFVTVFVMLTRTFHKLSSFGVIHFKYVRIEGAGGGGGGDRWICVQLRTGGGESKTAKKVRTYLMDDLLVLIGPLRPYAIA